jgi:hypothetical protein
MANKINNIPQHKTVVNTPTTPDLGFGRIYIKSDNQWYGLDDVGVETQLGGGSGGGINLTSLSANAPITYNNTNGTFSINQSNGSTNGYLSSTDWAIFNSKIGATSGTNNYVAKFTPNGTAIGNSLIQDDGTKIGINSAPDVGSKIYILSDQIAGINLNSNVSNINTAVGINLSVSGTNNSANTGIVSGASNGNFTTTGVQGSASSSTGVNKGIEGIASGTSTNIGLRGYAVNGSSNYSIQLQDGTQTVAGRFLKNMNTSGQANWANITAADVSGVQGALTLTTTGSSGAATLTGNTLNIPQYSGGSGGGVAGAGTLNYLTKWTPDGTTLGNSAIVEDANGYIGIATPVVTSIKVNIKSTSTYGVRILTSNSNLNGANYGLVAEGSKVGSNFDNTGVWGQAQGSTAENRGIHGTATTGNSLYASKQYAGVFEAYNGDPATPAHAGSIAVGIYVTASNKWGGSAYFARFEKYLGDPLNKVVLSDNIYGYADWGKVTSSYTTGATGTFTSADSKTITVNNGLITSIV